MVTPTESKTFNTKLTPRSGRAGWNRKWIEAFFISTANAELTSLDELLERYELEVLPSKKSHADVRSRLAIIIRLIGFYSAAALTPKVLAAYRDERLTKVKGHTVRKELHLIGRILKHAQKEWEINLPRGNPVDSVTIPSQPKGRERRLQSREEKKLLEAVNTFQAECSLDRQGGARFRPMRIPWMPVTQST